MPARIIHPRGLIQDGSRVENALRPTWVVCDVDDTRATLRVARAESYDVGTDTLTNAFATWTEGDGYRLTFYAEIWVSYDNGFEWEKLTTCRSGPEILRRQVDDDPDATRPVITDTRLSAAMRPEQNGVARLLRCLVDVFEDIQTEVELESEQVGPPRTNQPQGGSVTYEDSASASAEGASSVSSGNVTNTQTSNTASFAWGGVGASASLTVSSFNIQESAATAVTGGNASNASGPASEIWAYLRTGVGNSAHDADFTASASANDIFCGIQTCSDVDEGDPYDNVGTDTTYNFPTETSQTATSETDDRVLDGIVLTGYAQPTWTGAYTANVVQDIASGESRFRLGHEAGAATVGIGYDWSAYARACSYVWLNVNMAPPSVGTVAAHRRRYGY